MFLSAKKTYFWSNIFTPKKVSGVEIWNVGDRLKRVFPKFQPNRSYPRGVNGRSKFSNKSQNFDVLGVENLNVGDALKRVFPKFGADRSHPRGVNVRLFADYFFAFYKKEKEIMLEKRPNGG